MDENTDRGIPSKFSEYMRKNRIYFQITFKKPYSEPNVREALLDLGMIVPSPSDIKEIVLIGHRNKIVRIRRIDDQNRTDGENIQPTL